MAKKTNFKGLEVSELSFDRRKGKCSKLVSNSCGTRDCNLEVYKLGDDVILSGGLCPKGNTGLIGKRAPDYIKMYINILESHLSNLIKPLEENGRERILIPRSLTFLNEKGVYYCSIYKNLGFDVCISKESDEEISELGKSYSHSEFCYPLILAHGHAAYLKNIMKEGDKILLVDAISEDNEKYKFCPYVASSGHVIMGNLNLEENQVLIPIIYFNDKNYPVYKSIYDDLKRIFGNRFTKKQVKIAVEKAEIDKEKFLEEVHKKGEEILKGLKEIGEKAYVGIARGYTIFDNKASSNVHGLFVLNGLHFIPSYFIQIDKYNVDDFVENMYWYQGRRMLEQMIFALEEKGLFPIRLTNFNCGPDSIVYYHEEYLANEFKKPWLVLETDGHNSNAQFGTRILAHNRVVEEYLKNFSRPVSSSNFKKNIDLRETNFQSDLGSKSNIPEDFKERIIGIPYMGDGSDIMAATLRAVGLNSAVMPTRTSRSIEIAKKVVCTNTCKPFSFQIGDHLAWLESLEKKGIDINTKAAVLMPTAKGPCRFGQYFAVLRKFFEEKGYSGVTIMNPDSSKDYSDINLPSIEKLLIVRLFFKCNFANELLISLLLRTRPYEINKGESDELYNKSHHELIELTETKPSVKELFNFLKVKLNEFENIKKNDNERFPLVLMNGEIFLRSHELSNENSIKALEKHRLEVILDPIYSWINYVNKNSLEKSLQKKDLQLFGMSLIKRVYIKNIARKLFSPFAHYLKGREFHEIFHLIKDMEKDLVYSSAIEGESAVSIGTAYSFVKGEMSIDGIYHVGPFGCMQETIATSRTGSLINRRKDSNQVVPFMDAVFGETAISNLDSQIAIFAENCWLRKEMREGKK